MFNMVKSGNSCPTSCNATFVFLIRSSVSIFPQQELLTHSSDRPERQQLKEALEAMQVCAACCMCMNVCVYVCMYVRMCVILHNNAPGAFLKAAVAQAFINLPYCDKCQRDSLSMKQDFLLQDLAMYINEVKRDNETLKKISEFQSSIENLVSSSFFFFLNQFQWSYERRRLGEENDTAGSVFNKSA